MPHIVIEYSANLAEVVDIQDLVDGVHAAALADGLPALDALRTRAAVRDHFRVADGRPEFAFVAVVARIGPGRSADDKRRFLGVLIEAVDGRLEPVADRCQVALSAEIQEIDPELRINRNHVRTAMSERN
jgi:5-carboxymethyl-2-hydroxymuconate isomerase